MELVSRYEAQEKGLKRYFTNEPCANKHISERLVSSGRCAECNRANDTKKSNKIGHKLRKALYDKEYTQKNKDRIKKRFQRYVKSDRYKELQEAKKRKR